MSALQRDATGEVRVSWIACDLCGTEKVSLRCIPIAYTLLCEGTVREELWIIGVPAECCGGNGYCREFVAVRAVKCKLK